MSGKPPDNNDDEDGGEVSSRCEVLCDNITSSVYAYIRRGLFEADKLTGRAKAAIIRRCSLDSRPNISSPVATLLTFKILVNDKKLSQADCDLLINGCAPCLDPGNMAELGEWLPENIWAKVKSLENANPKFKGKWVYPWRFKRDLYFISRR